MVIFNHLVGLERAFAFALNEFQFHLDRETALVCKIHIVLECNFQVSLSVPLSLALDRNILVLMY